MKYVLPLTFLDVLISFIFIALLFNGLNGELFDSAVSVNQNLTTLNSMQVDNVETLGDLYELQDTMDQGRELGQANNVFFWVLFKMILLTSLVAAFIRALETKLFRRRINYWKTAVMFFLTHVLTALILFGIVKIAATVLGFINLTGTLPMKIISILMYATGFYCTYLAYAFIIKGTFELKKNSKFFGIITVYFISSYFFLKVLNSFISGFFTMVIFLVSIVVLWVIAHFLLVWHQKEIC